MGFLKKLFTKKDFLQTEPTYTNQIPKTDKLVSMFPHVGDTHYVGDVLRETGIKNLKSLKSQMSMLRHGSFTKKYKVPKEKQMSLKLKKEFVTRVQ